MDMRFQLKDVMGGWAVVTGASSGIGREYALALARHGLNVILVARRGVELRALADEIEGTTGMRALALPLDLTTAGASRKIAETLRSQSGAWLRVLVNNAGAGQWGRHDPMLVDRYSEVVALNVGAVTQLTTDLLPMLEAAAPSAVVQVSSQAALQPVPYMALYAASKAFVHSFGLALHEELRDRGILVQTLIPAPTATEFDRKAGAYASSVVHRGTAEAVVAASLEALDRGDPLATNARGLWKQRLFAALAPPKMVIREVGKMFKPPE